MPVHCAMSGHGCPLDNVMLAVFTFATDEIASPYNVSVTALEIQFARFSASIADDEPAGSVIAGSRVVELSEHRGQRFRGECDQRFDERAFASPYRSKLVVTKIVKARHAFAPRR